MSRKTRHRHRRHRRKRSTKKGGGQIMLYPVNQYNQDMHVNASSRLYGGRSRKMRNEMRGGSVFGAVSHQFNNAVSSFMSPFSSVNTIMGNQPAVNSAPYIQPVTNYNTNNMIKA